MPSPDSTRTAEEQREHEWLRELLVWAALPEVRRVPCPGSTEDGCRCPEHAPSPFPAPVEVRLNVVTLGASNLVRCTGSMTCSCERCAGEREAAVSRQRAARKRQPWEAKRVRSRPSPLAA